MKTLKKMLTNNWALKIVAFVVAAIVWLAVVNVNDPTIIDTITNVPIEIVNENAITDNNQVYTIDSKKYVNVTISGRRSLVRDLTAKSFVAQASLDEMSVTNSVPVVVTLKNKSLEGKVTISNQSVTQIPVHVENIETKSYNIEKNVTGTVAKNYELGTVTMLKDMVSITAPESVHEEIEKVVVDIDVSGATNDFSNRYKINMLDKNGNSISNSDISLSLKKVRVSVQVLKLITVPIVVETQGSPASGYEISSISTDPDSVTLVGPVSIINEIKEIKISGEVADITGITADKETTINLIDYLVSGVVIRGESDVKLSIQVEGDISEQYTFSPDDISIINIPEGLEAEILSESVTINVYGKERYFNGINKESFHASIDLKGLKAGRNSVDLYVTVPDGLQMSNTVKVKVKLSEKE